MDMDTFLMHQLYKCNTDNLMVRNDTDDTNAVVIMNVMVFYAE